WLERSWLQNCMRFPDAMTIRSTRLPRSYSANPNEPRSDFRNGHPPPSSRVSGLHRSRLHDLVDQRRQPIYSRTVAFPLSFVTVHRSRRAIVVEKSRLRSRASSVEIVTVSRRTREYLTDAQSLQ